MKRILSLILILLLTLAFTACAGAKETVIDSIGGKTPEAAYAAALTEIAEADALEISISASGGTEVMSISLSLLGYDNFYRYARKDGNAYCGMTEELEKELLATDLLKAHVEPYTGETYFLCGTVYERDGSDKTVRQEDTVPFSEPIFGELVSDVLGGDGGVTSTCYEIGGRECFRFTLSGDATSFDPAAEKEVYTVLFTDGGLLDEIEINVSYSAFLSCTFTASYAYGDAVRPIEAPEDQDLYTEK